MSLALQPSMAPWDLRRPSQPAASDAQDNDGGRHIWNVPPVGAAQQHWASDGFEQSTECDVPPCGKRRALEHGKVHYWKDMIEEAVGQETLILSELAMAEYHLRELQNIVQQAALQVEQKIEQLMKCRTHSTRLKEAVSALNDLTQAQEG